MANYQSIPRRFNKVTSSINHAYIDSALKNQQNTIDTNFGILQQTVDKTLGQDLIRESDRMYLKDKVRGVLNTLDNTDAITFDSKKTRFTIQDALSAAAQDPEVLRQIANTKKIRKIQDFYQKRLEKGDINQQNFQYAYQKSGVNDYLGGNSNDVGNFNYLEYVDVDAKMDEVARKLKASNPNELVSIQDPFTGKTVSKKVSTITPEEMRNYLRVQLNANDLKQLEIDGSMMYGMNDSAAIQYRDSLISKNNKKYADKVSLLENYRDNGNKTQGEIDQINSQIQALGAEKSYFEKSLIGKTTAEAIGGQQLLENKVDLYSKLYTKNGPESIKYDSDFLKRMRDANASANLSAKTDSRRSDLSTITVPTNLPEEVNPYQESLNRIDRTLKDNSNYLKNQFNSLSDDKKKLVQDTIDNIKNDPEFLSLYKGQNLSNETLQLEAINRLGANFFSPDVAKELRSRISSTKSIQEGIEKTTSEFVKSKVLSEEMFDQLFTEETNLTMATPQGDVNIRQFLQQNGVNDKSSYESFIGGESKEAKKLRATLALQSMSLTDDSPLTNAKLSDNPFKSTSNLIGNIGSTRNIGLSESEYRIMRQSVHDLTGESLEETYDIKKDGDLYNLTVKNDQTDFFRIVQRTNDLYQTGRASSIVEVVGEGLGFDIDRTVRNESSLRSLFSDKNYQEFAERNLTFLDKTVVGSNSIRVQGDIKKKVGPVFQEILKEVSNASAFDLTKPIDIYRREDNSLFVSQTSTKVDEDGDPSTKSISGIVQANDVPKMKIFNEQISLLKKENTFKNLEDISGKVNKMSFIRNNREQVEGLNRLYNKYTTNKGENMFRLLSAEATARKSIFSPDVNQYLSQDHPIRLQFEDFIRNTQNYNLDFTKGIDSPYQILIKDNDGNSVGSIPLNNSIPVEIFEKAFYGTPQIFLSLYTKSQVDKYMNNLVRKR